MVTPIEESAYDLLKQYLASLNSHFADEEGKDEIINDIEGRIAELFSGILKKGNPCITDEDVLAVINSIGRPEDFDDDEAKVKAQLSSNTGTHSSNSGQQQSSSPKGGRLYRDENNKVFGGVCSGLANYFGIDPVIVRIIAVITFGISFVPYLVLWLAVPSSATTSIGATRKRLMRDTDDKVIGGVCSGLSHYFGINVWIPRALFLIPFISIAFGWHNWGAFDFPNFLNFSFSPGTTLIYIILWLVLPEAKTTSEKLEMRGEKVDIKSIKNSVAEEMKGVGERVTKFSKEVGNAAKEKGMQVGSEAGTIAKKNGSTVGNIILLLVKIFAYFVLAVVLIALLGAFFGLGIAAFGLLPLKAYILENSTQHLLAWGTVLLFIWVPVVGIIVWVIRRLTGSKANSNMIRLSFIALWTLGWVCAISLIASISNDFRDGNKGSEENVYLSNPGIQKLEVKGEKIGTYYNNNYRWFHFEPFAGFDGDTAFVKNIRLRIIKSSTDSFQVKVVKQARGSSTEEANVRAGKIKFDVYQKDSLLMLDKGITISKDNIFRNQNVIVTIAVPVGKRIKIDENSGWDYNRFEMDFGHNDWNNWDWYNDEDAESWHEGVEYVMTPDGLKAVRAEDELRYENNYDDNREKSIEELENDMNRLQDELKEKQNQKDEKLKELELKKDEIEKMLKDKRNSDSSRYEYKPASETKETMIIPDQVPAEMPAAAGKVAGCDIKGNLIVKRFTM